MIKENNKPLFHPTFGSRPAQIVGRETIINECLQGLKEPVGARDRCRFYTGQRGMGKTALLLELADRVEALGFVIARVTAYEGMNDDIIETIQRNGAKYAGSTRKSITGASAGALGFSVGLSFSKEAKEQYGFRSKLTMLCDELAQRGKGILILVDEAKTSREMRELAITYQHLVGEDKNIAIIMAGLPQAVSSVLNDDVLTFLNRASKTKLEPISTNDIRQYYRDAFEKLGLNIKEDAVEYLADAAKGFPYLMQLIGYYACRNAKTDETDNPDWIDDAIRDARRDMAENVFAPILMPLSDNDRAFLQAMAKDDGASRIADICKRMGKSNSYIQPYRARMIDSGIVESPRNGELVFAVPYLGEYLRQN